MKRLALATLSLFFAASSGYAETVEVRSGSHETFTRLVLKLPKRMTPTIENGDTEATVSFPDPTLTFDTTPVFRRIGRDHIADISAGVKAGSLHLELGCNCEVKSFWHDRTLLVLDVREKDPSNPGVTSSDTPSDDVYSPAKKLRLSLDGANPVSDPLTLPPLPENDTEDASAELDNKRDSDRVIAKARERLVKQLGRAASQGLISPHQSLKIHRKPQSADQPSEKSTRLSDQERFSGTIDPADHVNLQAQSSIDRDFLDLAGNRARTFLGTECLEDTAVDVGSWGSDAPFAHQVGPLRVSLMGEFDRLEPETAFELAKLYLFFGFGVEARQTLELLPNPSEDSAVLQGIASIVENGYVIQPSILSSQLNCDGPAALWSILSYRSLPSDTPVDHNAALRAFDALPRHLRAHLGPILSRRFLDAGQKEVAEKVLRILDRHADTGSPDARLVDAELDRRNNNDNNAMTKLAEVVETNSEPSADAVIGLIDTKVHSGQPVSFDHAVLAGAYFQQHRMGPLSTDLARVYLIGLSASGAFDQAYAERLRLAEDLPATLQAKVDSEMLSQLTLRANDVTFLHHVFAHHADNHDTLASSVANAAAERLLETGFAVQARPFVEPAASGAASRKRQLLRARVSLADDLPRQAEADLMKLKGEEADLLRAYAKSRVGDHRAAVSYYSAIGQRDEALRQAWLSEDWKYLAASDNGDLASAAALAEVNDENSALLSVDDATEGVLTQNLGLIQQSSSTRGTIERILSANPTPEETLP